MTACNVLLCKRNCLPFCMHAHPHPHPHTHKHTHTLIGVEVKFKGAFYQTLISCSLVPELNKMEVTEEGLLVGSSVTLNKLADKLRQLHKTLPGMYRVHGSSIVLYHQLPIGFDCMAHSARLNAERKIQG